MTVGTKSILFGAHCFFLHPFFVARAWWMLYGFPWDPRLWVAFFVHDLGYIGKPNMDGPEGETHPELGAWIMSLLFDTGYPRTRFYADVEFGDWVPAGVEYGPWGRFTLLHSRYYAESLGEQPSRLCIADKLAIALTPAWLYLPMVRATGEIREYMANAKHRDGMLDSENERLWYAQCQAYCLSWVRAHRGGAVDTWTSDARNRATLNEQGVWK